MRKRILISALIGIVGGTYCWLMVSQLHLGVADFGWAVRGAQALLEHKNPYDAPGQLYPMPAILFGFPFIALRQEIAAGIFFGASSALMAFALIPGGYHRLLVFLAYPYWAAAITVQWTPLIFAGALLPWVVPSTMAKPQIGIPVFLTHVTKRGVLACVVFGLLSLLILPSWPLDWMHHFAEYDRFFPLLVLPGPMLALALLRYREKDASLLLLMSITPQRWFYDTLVLWLIPKSRREILFTVFWSWGAGIARWLHVPQSYTQVARWSILFIYVPMLIVLLARRRESSGSATWGFFETAAVRK